MVQLYTQSVDRNLAGIVRHDVPRVVTDARKFKAFKEFGQFSDELAREVLRPGFGPVLHVSDLPAGTLGEYRAGDEFHISYVIVRQHQAILDAWAWARAERPGHDAQWLALVRKATLIIESTILHELVHWGDLKADGHASDAEAVAHGWKDLGHMFVHHAYGSRFAVEVGRLRRREVRTPKLDIEGWMGWGPVEYDGKIYQVPYDPMAGLGPGDGPPLPPGAPATPARPKVRMALPRRRR